LAVVSVAASPAAAAPGAYLEIGSGTKACENGKFCLYKDADYNRGQTHAVLKTSVNINALGNFEFDDKGSSYFNNTGRVVTLYKAQLHAGAQLTVEAGARSAGLSDGWDNTITSIKFRS